jgi:hypothetical protein
VDELIAVLVKILSPYALWITALFLLSEILALIPSVAANGVFQIVQKFLAGIYNGIKNAISSVTPTTPTK